MAWKKHGNNGASVTTSGSGSTKLASVSSQPASASPATPKLEPAGGHRSNEPAGDGHKPVTATTRERAQEPSRGPRGPQPRLDWVTKYLVALTQNGGQKYKAAQTAKTNLHRVAEHRVRDPDFRKMEEAAFALARDRAESEAIRRAVEGIESTYTTKDGNIHYERKFSDTILLRLLERMETGWWRQKQLLEHSGSMTFKTEAERKEALAKARQELKLPPPETVARN